MSILINILLVIHVLLSLLIILVVLMQRPKNEGLGAAFGGGMTDNLFGAQTTNVLQSFTRWLGGIFFLLTIVLSWLYVRQTTATSNVQRTLAAPTVPVPAPAAVPAAGNTPATLPTNPHVFSPAVKEPASKPGAPAPAPGPENSTPTLPAQPGPLNPAPAPPGGAAPAPGSSSAPAPAPSPGAAPANAPQ